MYEVTYRQVGSQGRSMKISVEPNLTKAIEMSLAFFEVIKTFHKGPMRAGQRVIPTGAIVEIFAVDSHSIKNNSGGLVGFFRCQEIPDERK